jgi:predicted nucleic acid-binding protein
VIGTLGILRNASIAGLIDLPDALAALQQTSFYASPELIQSLIDEDVERRGRSNQL